MRKLSLLGPALAFMLAAGCVAPAQPPAPVDGTTSPVPSEAPSSAPVATTVNLTGTVYDDNLGPLVDVTVSARAGESVVGTATTDASGRFALQVPAGSYAVTASRAGWTSRVQTISVETDTIVPFGGIQGQVENPFFLSNSPEVSRVAVEEEAPGGPLTFRAEFSEPLPEASRRQWERRFRLEANGKEFLRASAGVSSALQTNVEWSEDGRIFTLNYAGPYVASGLSGMNMSVFLDQEMLDTVDPVTRENEWEDLGIVDAEGLPLGKGRADFVFLRESLSPLQLRDVADKAFGYTPELRRWNLTHKGPYSFQAKADTTSPALERVTLKRNATLGGRDYAMLELTFSEPMRAVRSAEEEDYTRLDKDDDLAIISVSKDATGTSPTALSSGAVIQQVRILRNTPEVVQLYYPPDTFKDYNWLEVTLGADVRDPAGNTADPDRSRAKWPQ